MANRTLADRILELTGAVTERETREQFLDKMDIERERGITIKAQNVRLELHRAKTAQLYQLNLIDTPGHVDFNYEVSRSLAACEGAILVVDSTQGVEAQTLANVYLAIDQGLEILPVLNKVDLPSADLERHASADRAGHRPRLLRGHLVRAARPASASPEILEQIVQKVPHPKGNDDAPLRALIFDTWYDSYRGAVVMIRVVDGHAEEGRQDPLHGHAGRDYEVTELGRFTPFPIAARGDRARRGRLPRREHQERARHEGRRHRDPRCRRRQGPAPSARRPSRCPASRTSSRWSSPGVFPTDSADYPICATRWRSST